MSQKRERQSWNQAGHFSSLASNAYLSLSHAYSMVQPPLFHSFVGPYESSLDKKQIRAQLKDSMVSFTKMITKRSHSSPTCRCRICQSPEHHEFNAGNLLKASESIEVSPRRQDPDMRTAEFCQPISTRQDQHTSNLEAATLPDSHHDTRYQACVALHSLPHS